MALPPKRAASILPTYLPALIAAHMFDYGGGVDEEPSGLGSLPDDAHGLGRSTGRPPVPHPTVFARQVRQLDNGRWMLTAPTHCRHGHPLRVGRGCGRVGQSGAGADLVLAVP